MRLSPYLLAFIVALAAVCGWAAIAVAQDVYPVSANMYEDEGVEPQADDGRQYGDEHGSCGKDGVFAGILDPGDCGPRWIFAAEAMVLQRVNTGRQTLFESLNTNSAYDLLDARDFRFPLELGPKLSAIRRGPCGWDVEVAYFQFDGFRDERFVPGRSLMNTDVNGGLFPVLDSTATYTSAIYCGEVNLRWERFDRLTLLAGFRMAELDERYFAVGTDVFSDLNDSVGVNVFNHLYGIQLGAEGEIFNRGGPLRLNAICKAGIFGNSADMNIRRVNPGVDMDEVLTSRKTHAAFIGEAGLSMTYALTTHLAFRASYSAIWVQGVALAPEQIDVSNFDTMEAVADLRGDIFYHGGGLGLEYRY